MANPEHVEIVKAGVDSILNWREQNESEDGAGFNLSYADLSQCDLTGADLSFSSFNWAHLESCDLTHADLSYCSMIGTNFGAAKLMDAQLRSSDFWNPNVQETNFMRAWLSNNSFSCANLSTAMNLGGAIFLSPSSIGLDTILRSGGNLPDKFLRGCGYDPLIQKLLMGDLQSRTDAFYKIVNDEPALVSFRLRSCFISFSFEDKPFADRLQSALNARGIDQWYAPIHGQWGERLERQIAREISLRDRLILICSVASLGNSQWVPFEYERALEKEKQTGQPVLFPVTIDDSVFGKSNPMETHLCKYLVGDFRGATEPGPEFEKRVDRLVEGLKAADKK